jgi:hypothetical protein
VQIAWPPPNRRLGTIDALGLCGLLGLLVARFIPVAKIFAPIWYCPLRRSTGWPCPGCGLTRVADHVAHLHLLRAWDANPLGTIGALAFAACALAMVLHLAFALPVPDVRLSAKEGRAVRIALVAAVVLNYAFVVVKAKFPFLLG